MGFWVFVFCLIVDVFERVIRSDGLADTIPQGNGTGEEGGGRRGWGREKIKDKR